MAFCSAIQLMAFASVTQASAVAEGPANALIDKPTASATEPQRRILYRILNEQDNCYSSSDCNIGSLCEKVDIYHRDGYSGELTAYDKAMRCNGVKGIQGVLQAYNWGIPILGTFVMSSVPLLVAFLSGLPSRWTRGDYSTIFAILLQLGSTAFGIIEVQGKGKNHHLLPMAIAFLLSYPFLFGGLKSASRRRVMKKTATQFMIGTAFFTLILGSGFGYLALNELILFRNETRHEKKY
jgi:hypothetical protein